MTNINIKLVSQNLILLNFDLDGQCGLCKNGLRKLIKFQAQNKNAYGSRNLQTGKNIGCLKMFPDYNANGVLTHWHVS